MEKYVSPSLACEISECHVFETISVITRNTEWWWSGCMKNVLVLSLKRDSLKASPLKYWLFGGSGKETWKLGA